MTSDAYIISIFRTPAARFPEKSPKALDGYAYLGGLQGACIGGAAGERIKEGS